MRMMLVICSAVTPERKDESTTSLTRLTTRLMSGGNEAAVAEVHADPGP